jgi:beta-galactosidase
LLRIFGGKGTYRRNLTIPEFKVGEERVYLEFHGAASSAEVWLNGKQVCRHDGGYSTFRADVTDYLREENDLKVTVD